MGKIHFVTVRTLDEEIDSDSEGEFHHLYCHYDIFSSHNSDSEFNVDNKIFEMNQESDTGERKYQAIWQKDKLNPKVRTKLCNIIAH